jgi:heterodisulfide reductase subunit A
MKNIVTIGGGIAGIEASNVLANLGYNVTIIDKEKKIGGKLNTWDHLFPDFKPANELLEYAEKILKNENISVKTGAEIEKIEKQNNAWYVYTGNIRYSADAIIVATGYDLFNAERKEEYGYSIYNNVITSADLEKILKEKKVLKTYEGRLPEKIAIIHCVGSRDEKSNNHYCSKVCCVTGVKQAIEINNLIPTSQIYCFYMDLRMFDKHFEELYRTAQQSFGIQFIRGRVSEVAETIDKKLILKTEDTLSGRPLKLNIDMIVLLVGMEAGEGTEKIGKLLQLNFEESRFIKTRNEHEQANLSLQKGVFTAGTCTAPMTIKETMENARSAAFEVHKYLNHN